MPDGCGLSNAMLEKLNRSDGGVVQKIVGYRGVRLDCADELAGYYREYGFHFVKKNIDKDLNQMIMLL